MLKEQIKKWFEESVRLNFKIDPELKRILLSNPPNLDKFITNLCREFENADRVCRSRGLVLKQKTIQDTVYDMTEVFITVMENEAKRRYETDLAKLAREKEAAQIKEFEDVLSGNATGEFAEAGVITNEKIDAQREKALFEKAQAEGRIQA